MFREEKTSALAGFHASWNLGMLVFVEAGKPENPEKNHRSKDENQQQTQPTCGTGLESNPGHIGGRRELLSLHPAFLLPNLIKNKAKSQKTMSSMSKN